MKKEQKEKYESPSTRKTQVNLESGFMQSSADVQNPNNAENGQIEEHEVNKDFDFGFNDQYWD
ncbi:hypothetical protein [Prevotella sp.]|uniref:hypothetical protein n=1 Tax=Prevotella sp. TaxID=59823 RepID=UPI003AB54CA6